MPAKDANSTAPKNKGHRYQVGHPYYPGRAAAGPGRMSIKRQRAAQAKLIGDMLLQMAEQHAAGIPIDPTDVTRLVHTHRLLLPEL